jgi:branched-chain amino acid transport system substrate-binding protein
VEMRATDHQLQQPLVIATWSKVDGKTVKIDQENTGFGWKTESVQPAFVGVQPTSCQMKRPAKS